MRFRDNSAGMSIQDWYKYIINDDKRIQYIKVDRAIF